MSLAFSCYLTQGIKIYQFLGGLESSLVNGPVYLQVRPNFKLSLIDPYFKDCLTIAIKITGLHMKHGSHNIELAYNVLARAINTRFPSIYEGQLTRIEAQDYFLSLKGQGDHSQRLTPDSISWDIVQLPND